MLRMRSFFFVFAFALLSPFTIFAQTTNLKITATDEAGKPLAAVKIELAGAVAVTVVTDEKGQATIPNLAAGTYKLTATKEGLEPRTKTDLVITAGVPNELELLMVPKVNITDTVNVTASNAAANPLEQGAAATTEVSRQQAKDTAIRPHTVADALPLIPGVVRDLQGQLHISGSGENRNALLVNAMDVTDPATGQFGMTIPIDSVQTLNVYKSPFFAQYGRFTAGVVSVETRRGGDKWNFELNDPFPEFRFLRRHLRGMHSATPRINFNGPLIKNKLYFTQGIEYALKKNRVLSLTFPNNETVNESVNSFSQFDYIGLKNHAMTATVHIAPRHSKWVNLDFFNRRPVTPNMAAHDYTTTFIDRWTLGTNLLETNLSVKNARQDVWPGGNQEMTLTPTGNTGNYFNQQDRNSSRVEWMEILTFRPVNKWGTHNFKIGSDITRTHNRGQFFARPVNIVNTAGQRLKRIEFVGGSQYDRKDLEVSGFGQDHWVMTKNFSFDYGLRFERQGITETQRFAPRAGFAWTPFGNDKTVLRGGFGLFYDRVPLNVYSFSSYPDQVVTTYGANGAIIDGPRRFYNFTDRAEASGSIFIRSNRNAIGNFAPHTATSLIEIEHPVNSHIRVRANYQKSNSSGLIMVAPTVVNGRDVLSLSSRAKAKYHQIELTTRVSWKDEQQLFLSYVHSRSRGDLNEFNNYLGSYPYPIVRPNQYTNLPGDLPHRFLAWGTVKLPWKVTWFPMAELRNGMPYSLIDAAQNYVGVANSQRFPKFFSFDSRVRRDFKVNDKYSIRVSLSGFNITNHFNPPSLHNNIADPQFGLFFGQNTRRIRLDFDVLF
ncbi:MAG TPA: TonB-dependent receptor [Blastocatellia bacterium]|nr:TonB-dependent receptor [Blastocatellia bacterium]